MGSVPRKPPRAMTGLPVVRIRGSAVVALSVATRKRVLPCCASRYVINLGSAVWLFKLFVFMPKALVPVVADGPADGSALLFPCHTEKTDQVVGASSSASMTIAMNRLVLICQPGSSILTVCAIATTAQKPATIGVSQPAQAG